MFLSNRDAGSIDLLYKVKSLFEIPKSILTPRPFAGALPSIVITITNNPNLFGRR
jgi:hypothetical protein